MEIMILVLSWILITIIAGGVAAVDGLFWVAEALGVIPRRPLLALQLVFFFPTWVITCRVLGPTSPWLSTRRHSWWLKTVFNLESLNLEFLIRKIVNKLGSCHFLRSRIVKILRHVLQESQMLLIQIRPWRSRWLWDERGGGGEHWLAVTYLIIDLAIALTLPISPDHGMAHPVVEMLLRAAEVALLVVVDGWVLDLEFTLVVLSLHARLKQMRSDLILLVYKLLGRNQMPVPILRLRSKWWGRGIIGPNIPIASRLPLGITHILLLLANHHLLIILVLILTTARAIHSCCLLGCHEFRIFAVNFLWSPTFKRWRKLSLGLLIFLLHGDRCLSWDSALRS